MYSHNKKPIIYSGHSVYIASVVKTVIENFLLVTNSRIIHTRFNLCCVALKWATFFFSKAHNHEDFKRGPCPKLFIPKKKNKETKSTNLNKKKKFFFYLNIYQQFCREPSIYKKS